MELHFCSQCGISIPLAEVQSGVAAAGDGRTLCSEHRAGAKPAGAGDAPPADVELLFCANCQVSVPVGDVQDGRAKREFGSLLCAACSAGDVAERERRKKAVEAEMAEDAAVPSPVPGAGTTRSCSVCAGPVTPALIAAGKALVDGSRVVCPRCRDAGATAAAPAASGAGTWVLVVLLVAAFGAAGFFGAEYVQSRRKPAEPAFGAREYAALQVEIDRRFAELATALEERDQAQRDARKEDAGLLQTKITEELLAVREDLAEVRTRLTASDGALAERVARLEGNLGVLQEMIKGLASRPATPEAPRPNAAPEATQPPPPGPEAPPPAPDAGPPVDPEVARLVRDLLESKDEGVRFAAAAELTRRKERLAIPAFAKQVIDDPNVIVRRACARGLGEVRAWHAVPVLVQALEDKEAYVAQQANFALQAITGQDFGVTIDTDDRRDRKTRAAAARRWWEKNREAPPDGVCLDPVAASR